jgi:transcriptional regulator with XRE-family HTH domain
LQPQGKKRDPLTMESGEEHGPEIKIYGRNIVKIRRQRGWTRKELAARIHVLSYDISPKTIAHIEKSKTPLTAKQIAIFVEIFNINTNNLGS